jgi:hypothetical protein
LGVEHLNVGIERFSPDPRHVHDGRSVGPERYGIAVDGPSPLQ